MELVKQITLDCLTADAVSIGAQQYLLQEGLPPVPVGDTHRTAFVNSARGRDRLQGFELDENFKQAIFAVWGETPTVVEEPPKNEDSAEDPPGEEGTE